jgi:hypothetical protein
LHSNILAYVSTISIKDILTKPDSEGRRGKWISKIQEYDVEINPTKLVKGQGVAKVLDNSNFKSLGTNSLSISIMETKPEGDEKKEPYLKVRIKFLQLDWYKDIIFYLHNLSFSPTWEKSKDRSIKLKAMKYCILDKNVFWKDPGGIFLNFLIEEETEGIVPKFHK